MQLETVYSFIFDLPKHYNIETLSYKKIGELFALKYKFLENNISWIKKFYYYFFRFLCRKRFLRLISHEILKEIDHDSEETELNNLFVLISKDYLNLTKEPCIVYLSLKGKALNDIKEIDTLIHNYQEEISDNEEKKNSGLVKPDIINYDNKLLNTNIERLIENKIEIQTFLKIKIQTYSITECFSLLGPLTTFRVPYQYAWFPNFCTSKADVSLIIKFQNLPITEIRKIQNEYETDPDSIYIAAENYINAYNIKQNILDSLNDNHILKNRESIFQKILSFYNVDNYVFCNLAITQVEGLLSDYCLEFGCSEKELFVNAIGYKSQVLYDKNLLSRPAFDYFSSIFPVNRNRLMHGMNIISDFDNLAKLVLLDLNFIVELSKKKIFDFNLANTIIQNCNSQKTFENIFDLCLLLDYKFDNFYNIETKLHSLFSTIDWQLFFNDLETKCLSLNYNLYAFHVVLNLKKNNIETIKCINFFKKFSKKCKDIKQEEINTYLHKKYD